MVRLLVTGEMRSGTTLVANFLDAQKGVTLYRDFLPIQGLRKEIGVASLEESLTKPQKTKLIYSFNYKCNAKLGFTLELFPTEFSSLIEFYIYVLEEIAQPEDIVVGHKTTRAYEVVDDLMQLVPDLKVILIRRDPRDVVSSAIERWGNRHDRSVFYYIENWLESHTFIERHARSGDEASEILVLRYEDLLLSTDCVLSDIAEFLGMRELVVPKTMSDYGSEWLDNSSFGDLERVFDPTPIGRWRDRSPRIGRISEILLFDAMSDAGYQISEEFNDLEKTRVEVRYQLYRLVRKIPVLFRLFETRVLVPLQERIADC